MAQGSTKCPFCEEVVIGDATVCHYCGRDLPIDRGGGQGGARSAWQTARTFIIIVVIALLVLVLVFVVRSWLARFAPPPFAALWNWGLVAG